MATKPVDFDQKQAQQRSIGKLSVTQRFGSKMDNDDNIHTYDNEITDKLNTDSESQHHQPDSESHSVNVTESACDSVTVFESDSDASSNQVTVSMSVGHGDQSSYQRDVNVPVKIENFSQETGYGVYEPIVHESDSTGNENVLGSGAFGTVRIVTDLESVRSDPLYSEEMWNFLRLLTGDDTIYQSNDGSDSGIFPDKGMVVKTYRDFDSMPFGSKMKSMLQKACGELKNASEWIQPFLDCALPSEDLIRPLLANAREHIILLLALIYGIKIEENKADDSFVLKLRLFKGRPMRDNEVLTRSQLNCIKAQLRLFNLFGIMHNDLKPANIMVSDFTSTDSESDTHSDCQSDSKSDSASAKSSTCTSQVSYAVIIDLDNFLLQHYEDMALSDTNYYTTKSKTIEDELKVLKGFGISISGIRAENTLLDPFDDTYNPSPWLRMSRPEMRRLEPFYLKPKPQRSGKIKKILFTDIIWFQKFSYPSTMYGAKYVEFLREHGAAMECTEYELDPVITLCLLPVHLQGGKTFPQSNARFMVENLGFDSSIGDTMMHVVSRMRMIQTTSDMILIDKDTQVLVM
jgi:serine/threonine protein kinase